MPDRDEIMKALEKCSGTSCRTGVGCTEDCPYFFGWLSVPCNLRADTLALLKEQEAEIDEISDEYLDLGKEMAKQPKIVRCKDCKHWYFADNRIPSEQENVCGRNGIVVSPDWFCADGERRTDDA